MREEKAKKDAKDRIRTIKAVIHPEVVAAGEGKSSTLVAQVAKKLLRLTLVALLAEEGGALGQSSGHCYVATVDSASTAPMALGTIFTLSFVIFVVVFVMTILLSFIWRLQRQISQLKEVVMNARQALQDSRGQWRERQTHAGVYFEESETEVASEELDLHAYSVRVEETMDIEENLESELGEESDVEIEVTKGSVSYLSSPCFSTSIGGIGGPARVKRGILAVMYWISIIRGPPPSKMVMGSIPTGDAVTGPHIRGTLSIREMSL